MSLIRDIQAAAISQSTDVPTLLRMCKLLAARLGSDTFAQWVECELNGYPDVKSLPPYRIVSVDSYGTFIGEFARADRLQIPISILPEKIRDTYRHAYMLNGVSAYVSLVQGEKAGTALEQWPMELAVHHASKAVINMQCVSAWKEIPIGAVVRLLDSVKTRVLGFAIDLEREAPDAGDSPLGRNPVSQEKLTQIFNTNIAGNVANLANASSGFSQVANIATTPGDWSSLKSHLQSLGLKDTDYEGLKTELEAARGSGRPPQEALESVSSSWIGKLAARAAQGATGVGIEVAATGVAKAIATYLGFPAGQPNPLSSRQRLRLISNIRQQRQDRRNMMKNHMITGGGGIRLHIVETGNSRGRPIVFIHGFSQCWLAWARQLNSDLADTFRLVAVDIRDHGLSDKPRESYSDSKLWADDVHAAIQALELDHPILCGWSYGPLIILDYIRHYGEDDIRGVNFIGGVTKLGSEEAASVLTADFLSLLPGFFSTDAQESVRALDSLLRMCFAHELAVEDRYLMLGYNSSVPPYVRQALFSRSFDNDDLLPKIRKPVLITHGGDDAVVKSTVIEQQMARITHAQIRMMANAGHACFWDEAATYNRCLQEFVDAL